MFQEGIHQTLTASNFPDIRYMIALVAKVGALEAGVNLGGIYNL